MRQIICRGKDKDTGEWLYGWYCEACHGAWPLKPVIIQIEKARRGLWETCEIVPETVGQYTGLTDYFNTPIYEGDILESRASEDERDWKKWLVTFEDGMFEVSYQKGKRKRLFERDCLCNDNLALYGFVIVGNIYENPDLMEVR